MPAAAAARTAAPRVAPARRPRPAPRRAPARRAPSRRAAVATRRGNGLVPHAVGRTALAVAGIAESGLIYRLTRGRLWIGVLGGLLVGIVALNVIALSFSATSSKTASQADDIKRENSSLRAQLAARLSNERLQRTALSMGLEVPAPGSISYLEAHRGDAARAAQRLRDGQLTLGTDYAAPTTPETLTSVPAAPATSVAAPAADPAAAPPATDPAVAPAPSASPPAAPVTPAATVPAGGIAAP